MVRRGERLRGACLCLLLVVSAFSNARADFASSPANPSATKHVRLQLKWRHQFQFAGYYAALYKGFYRQRGLDVSLIEGGPSVEPMQAVLGGSADFGVGTTDLLLMRAQGKPVALLADIFQHSPLALLARASHPARNIHELAKGRLMIEPNSAELLAYFKSEGIDTDTLNVVDHYDIQELLDNESGIDAISVYVTHGPFILQERNIDYQLYRPIQSGIDFYGDNLFTVQSFITKHPRIVQDFLQASLQGWKYAMSHQDEVIAYILDNYSVHRSRESLLFEANQMEPLILPEIVEVGYINRARWGKIADYYHKAGLIQRVPDLTQFIYSAPTGYLAELSRLWNAYKVRMLVAALSLVVITLVFYNWLLKRHVAARTVELQQALLTRSRFMAAAGHDLRQPLHAAGLFIQTMQAQLTSGEQAETLGKVQGCIDNLNDSFNELLDVSQLDRGEISINKREVHLRPLFGKLDTTYHAAAVSKGLQLRIQPCRKHVVSDSALLERILSNLLSNAIRYTKAGSIDVFCEEGESHVTIHVSDTGIGIPTDKLDEIFAEFSRLVQLGSPERDGERGFGLGLFITKQLADSLGHSLGVSSSPNKGSDFYLSVPVGNADPTVLESPIPTGRSLSSQLPNRVSGCRLLVVDDSEDVLSSMQELVSSWGCQPFTATSPSIALQMLRDGLRPHVVIADFEFPGDMDGVDCVNRIWDLAGSQIPSLIITGSTDTAAHAKIGEVGIDKMLKPVKPAKLRVYLNNVFGKETAV